MSRSTDEIIADLRDTDGYEHATWTWQLEREAADRLETLQQLVRLAGAEQAPPVDELALLRLMVQALHLRETTAAADATYRCHQ